MRCDGEPSILAWNSHVAGGFAVIRGVRGCSWQVMSQIRTLKTHVVEIHEAHLDHVISIKIKNQLVVFADTSINVGLASGILYLPCARN